MAFSLDAPEVIATFLEAHRIGITVRMIIDLEQAQHFGMRTAMKTRMMGPLATMIRRVCPTSPRGK